MAKPSRKPASAGKADLHGSELRKIESRRKLIAAARKLFSLNGYHETRTQDIAKEAEVAHGTFYFHFEDKLDCFIAFVNDVSNEVSQAATWNTPAAADPAEAIKSLLGVIFSYSRLFPGTISAMLSNITILAQDRKRRKQRFFGDDIWTARIEEWKRTGKCSAHFDTKIFNYLVTGAIKQGDAYIARHPRSEKKVLDQMTEFLVNAIKAG